MEFKNIYLIILAIFLGLNFSCSKKEYGNKFTVPNCIWQIFPEDESEFSMINRNNEIITFKTTSVIVEDFDVQDEYDDKYYAHQNLTVTLKHNEDYSLRYGYGSMNQGRGFKILYEDMSNEYKSVFTIRTTTSCSIESINQASNNDQIHIDSFWLNNKLYENITKFTASHNPPDSNKIKFLYFSTTYGILSLESENDSWNLLE